MLDQIATKVEAWLSRWGDLVWHPLHSFGSAREEKELGSFEFFVGNCLASFLASILACVLYFLVSHRQTFTAQLRSQGAGLVTSATALFAAYVVLALLTIMIGAAISYSIYRLAGSQSSFIPHVNAYLELSFLDAIAAFAITLLLLQAEEISQHADIILRIMAFIFLGVRVWYLVVGYWAMRSIHRLSKSLTAVAYIIGFAPSYIVINSLGLGLSWVLTALIVAGGD
jgi:hypothetical protein